MKKVLFLLLLALLVYGCAGPKMYTVPPKPLATEREAKEFPKHIQVSYDPMPGEILKSDFYSIVTVEKNRQKPIIYITGQISNLIIDVTDSKRIISNMSGEFSVGTIGESIKKSKLNCKMTCSDRGGIYSSNCEGINPYQSTMPDFPISPGNQWNETIQIDDKDLGKVELHGAYRFSRFVYLDNRLCARIEFEGEYKPLKQSETLRALKLSGVTYFDVGLREMIYSNASVSGEAVDNNDIVLISLEFVLKLNFTDSIIKRSSITEFKN